MPGTSVMALWGPGWPASGVPSASPNAPQTGPALAHNATAPAAKRAGKNLDLIAVFLYYVVVEALQPARKANSLSTGTKARHQPILVAMLNIYMHHQRRTTVPRHAGW